EVAVFWDGVGTDALVALDKQVIQFRFAARPADAAERIGNDAGRFNEPGLQQGNYRKQNARGIATRGGDQCAILYLGAIDFRQTIDRKLEQIGGGMLVAIEFVVFGGAFDAKISAQIDDLAAKLEQRNGKLRSHAMWQSQENDLRSFGQQLRVGFAETQRPRV